MPWTLLSYFRMRNVLWQCVSTPGLCYRPFCVFFFLNLEYFYFLIFSFALLSSMCESPRIEFTCAKIAQLASRCNNAVGVRALSTPLGGTELRLNEGDVGMRRFIRAARVYILSNWNVIFFLPLYDSILKRFVTVTNLYTWKYGGFMMFSHLFFWHT